METERRHEERLKIPRVTIACTRLEWTYSRGTPNVARALLDVSTGGARVIAAKPLEEGEPVSVRLDARNRRRSVSIPGEVRWLKALPAAHGRSPSYVAGLRFVRSYGVLELLLKA